MAADLEIRLLGGIHLTLNQIGLTSFVSNKAPALLAYLAVTRRPHQRDALAALLWGELADADAKNNLRQTLSNLRRLLDPYLLVTRDTVAFNLAASYDLDVAVFEERLRTGPVGLEAVAATLNQDAGTLEDVVEPYLLQIGFLARTRRGRMLTPAGALHIGIPGAGRTVSDSALFEG